MATVTWKGHTFNTNTDAHEFFVKKDEKGFTKHMSEVAEKAKDLLTKYAHLEKPPAHGMTRWIPGIGLVLKINIESTKHVG